MAVTIQSQSENKNSPAFNSYMCVLHLFYCSFDPPLKLHNLHSQHKNTMVTDGI